MAGSKKSISQLHELYSYFVPILNNNNIDFILFFGTVLGIIRENNFIEGDDDIDVIVDRKYYEKINIMINRHKLKVGIKNKNLIQLFKDDLGPFDIYFYDIRDNKCFVPWEGLIYNTNLIFPPQLIKFKGYKVKIPNKSQKFISEQYGILWRIKNSPKITMTKFFFFILLLILKFVTISFIYFFLVTVTMG
jgi:phosphorylcholine metabolism protein LicD